MDALLERPFADKIRDQFRNLNQTLVVVDDDPTGTQTVHGVPVLGEWSEEVFTREFENNTAVLFVLANTRSLPLEAALERADEIGNNLRRASENTGRKFILVSRSDSTLRGHFPDENRVLAKSAGFANCPTLLIPVFFEGGRVTIEDVHYIKTQEKLTPVNETPFANDKSFGYKNANLKEWIKEKSKSEILDKQLISIPVNSEENSQALINLLQKAEENSYLIFNGTTYTDLEILCLELIKAISKGHRFMFRTAASFVSAFSGITANTFKPEATTSTNGGLIIVGSYVPLTTQQVEVVKSTNTVKCIEAEVDRILDTKQESSYQEKLQKQLEKLLILGEDCLIYTSRELVTGGTQKQNLEVGKKITDFLVAILSNLSIRPSYIIAKGGITSNDIAVRGLGMKRASIKGQLIPGVPVWEMGMQSKFSNLHYVVFPGNVGDENSLLDAIELLRTKQLSK